MVPRAPLWGYRGRISLAHPPRPTVRSRLCAARFTSTSPPPSSRAGEGRRPHYALWTALALGAAAAAAYHSDFLRRLGGSDDAAGLSPHRWTPLTVSSVEDLPDGLTKIITLTLPQTASGSSTASDGDGRLHIDTVYVKQPDLMIQRPYTPLDPLFDGASSIRLLVKRYADGEVSSYLHRLGPGAKVEVRGPERSWQEQREGQVREIVFVRLSLQCDDQRALPTRRALLRLREVLESRPSSSFCDGCTPMSTPPIPTPAMHPLHFA